MADEEVRARFGLQRVLIQPKENSVEVDGSLAYDYDYDYDYGL